MKTLNELAKEQIRQLLELPEEELRALFAQEQTTDLSPLLEHSGMFSTGAFEAALQAEAMSEEGFISANEVADSSKWVAEANIETYIKWQDDIDLYVPHSDMKISVNYSGVNFHNQTATTQVSGSYQFMVSGSYSALATAVFSVKADVKSANNVQYGNLEACVIKDDSSEYGIAA